VVVMNQGRIEQVDDPYTLYTRPRSRFVAGFIGRTNFIDAARSGEHLVFDGGQVPAGSLKDAPGNGNCTLSVRPQNIGLSRGQPSNGRWALFGEIVERAYLGEHWDYHVRLGEGATTLRVSVPPATVHAVHDRVWLDIDPAQVVVLR
jgi:iron(III) transport system ATP-binding protein